jgi:hypothetical protein
MRLPHRAIYRQFACDGTLTSSRRFLAVAAVHDLHADRAA